MELNFIDYKLQEFSLMAIAEIMESKIQEAELTNPEKDYTEQHQRVKAVREAVYYFRELFNEAEALKRANNSITLANVKLMQQNELNEAEINKIRQVNEEIGV